MSSTTALVWMIAGMAVAGAQAGPCGLSTVTESSTLIYPPIAKAAHVGGTVILVVTFALNGSVTRMRDISGPQMLRYNSEEFVKGWKANSYSGPRECPVVVTFVLGKEADDSSTEVVRTDQQHVTITTHLSSHIYSSVSQ